MDYAGQSITEILLNTSKPAANVYHIVNPNTAASWEDIIDGLAAAGVKFDKVDRTAWVERLAASEQDPEKNPTVKLLGFFRKRYGPAFKKPMVFSTEETLKWAPALGRAPPITKELVGKWVANWKKNGFIN